MPTPILIPIPSLIYITMNDTIFILLYYSSLHCIDVTMILPSHWGPSPLKPGSHKQVKLPSVLVHTALSSSQLSVSSIHSSISVDIIVNRSCVWLIRDTRILTPLGMSVSPIGTGISVNPVSGGQVWSWSCLSPCLFKNFLHFPQTCPYRSLFWIFLPQYPNM